MINTYKNKAFRWTGLDKHQRKVHGTLQAINASLVKVNLRRQGIIPLRITRIFLNVNSLKKAKIKSRDISTFTQQLATLLTAGIPLLQALITLEQGQKNSTLKQTMQQMKSHVEQGIPLSKTLEAHPSLFNNVFIGLVKVGEHTGALDKLLTRIAEHREHMDHLKRKIKKALFYPVIVLMIALLMTLGLLIFIVPQFASIFASFGAPLPLMTRIVIGLSHELLTYGWLVGILLGFGIWCFHHAGKNNPTFAYQRDHAMLTIKLIGPMLRQAITARIASTLAIMLAAGMTLIDALQIAAEASGNLVYRQALRAISDEILTGQRLTMAMQKQVLFSPLMIDMVAVGEESGKLDLMLSKVANFYDEQVNHSTHQLTTLMEPLVMLILGLLIGILVIALYLPIFRLGSIIGGHA